MIKPVQMICPKDKWDIKCPYEMKPQGIVVHNTANDATARQEISYMNRNNKYCSFQYAIDDKEVVQGLPEDRNNFSCGDGASGKGNRTQIAIEICYSKSGGKRFDDAEKLAAKFIAQLLKKYGWGIDKVTKHQDYSGKYCPHRTLDRGWPRFLKMIEIELEELEERPVQPTRFKVGDSVKITGEYYTNTPKPVKVSAYAKARTHTIKQFNKDQTKALLKEINSWVFVKDIFLAKKAIDEGAKVRIKEGAKYGGVSSGTAIPSYKIKGREYTVIDTRTYHGVKEAHLLEFNSWVPVKYLY